MNNDSVNQIIRICSDKLYQYDLIIAHVFSYIYVIPFRVLVVFEVFRLVTSLHCENNVMRMSITVIGLELGSIRVRVRVRVRVSVRVRVL